MLIINRNGSTSRGWFWVYETDNNVNCRQQEVVVSYKQTHAKVDLLGMPQRAPFSKPRVFFHLQNHFMCFNLHRLVAKCEKKTIRLNGYWTTK